MPKRKRTFINPFLTEYVYACLHNASPEQKKNASKSTLRLLTSPVRAKNFAVHSTDDEKKKVLSELNYQWATVIMPNGVKSVNELKKMMNLVEDGRTAAGVNHLTKEGIFITTDKQLVFILGVAAQTIAHSNYFMNLDLIKTGNVLKRWSKRVEQEDNKEVLEAIEYADLLDKTIYKAVETLHYTDGLLGLTQNEFLILQYLSINKHLYFDRERIMYNFSGVIKTAAITLALKNLHTDNYIRKSVNSRPIKYTITASGIELVARFRNRVLSNIN